MGVFKAHNSTVYSVERHPHNPKNFLTVGDYGAKIFSEEVAKAARERETERVYTSN